MISDSVKRGLSNFLSFNVNVLSSNFNLISTTGHFSRYITEINNDTIKEVPSYNITVRNRYSYLFPLDYIPIVRKTFGIMIKDLSMYRGVGELNQTKDKDGNIYYGCKGLILDRDFNPLVLTSRLPIFPLLLLIAPVLSTLKLLPTLMDAPLISSDVSLTK